MSFKQLYIFVEGEDDKRFFDNIIKLELSGKYDSINIIRYAKMKKEKEKVNNFIISIKKMNADYIFAHDIDNTVSTTSKKIEIKHMLKNIENSIVKNTDEITKESFNNMISDRFDSRITFMIEILKNFSIKIAIQKNKSFKYFIEKMNIIAD
ncbi:hypothetical protein [Marinitoga sp. 1155]|uniref:hypothetical protein n=1 Tax=Marinitoga sp. 1155 TaxID=1428448 RepID=UPI00064153C6|nr:hypothetical protein [Marinitoga sp. 1155]KLO21555.1 hypothetical protein X274_10245 [Marinitoga sp. 1155]